MVHAINAYVPQTLRPEILGCNQLIFISFSRSPDTGNTFEAYKAKAQQAATPSTPAVGTLPVGGLRKLHIDVGFNGLMFNPNNVTELVGTVVEFSYNPSVRIQLDHHLYIRKHQLTRQ